MKNIHLARAIGEGLAYSFEMEYIDRKEIREIFRPGIFINLLYPANKKGRYLAMQIWKVASRRPWLRAQIRKEILERGFRTADEAMQYVREEYG